MGNWFDAFKILVFAGIAFFVFLLVMGIVSVAAGNDGTECAFILKWFVGLFA